MENIYKVFLSSRGKCFILAMLVHVHIAHMCVCVCISDMKYEMLLD